MVSKERPCVPQAAGLGEQGYVNLLEYPWCYHEPQMLDMDLQVLVFALLGFGLALI